MRWSKRPESRRELDRGVRSGMAKMTSRTLPKRVSDFLLEREQRAYCDGCIQQRMGLKWRQQVQLITATLAVTSAFERQFEQCSTCNEMKQVTKVRSSRPASQAETAALRSGQSKKLAPRQLPTMTLSDWG